MNDRFEQYARVAAVALLAIGCFLVVQPFLGAIIYLIARPKMTAQDQEDMARMQEAERRISGYSPADEVAKLSKLRDEGKITAEEYEEMKKRAMMQI